MIGTFRALDPTGTPIAVINNDTCYTTPAPTFNSVSSPSPTPTRAQTPSTPLPSAPTLDPTPTQPALFVAPEYNWAALLALFACFASLAVFKKTRKYRPTTT